MGQPETIDAKRESARGYRVELEALQEAFDAYPDPVGADQLPLLIERVALAFARTPHTSEGRGPHEFFSAIIELKRLTSPARPGGMSIEEGVAQARTRVE